MVVVARRVDELDALAAELGGNVEIMPCDLGDDEARAALVGRLADTGPVDVMVAAAGFGGVGSFQQADWATVSRMLDVNVAGVMQLVHGVLPGMVERRQGRVMVVGSGAGHTAMRGSTAYATTKWALHGFCESLRLDLLDTGVTVTEIAPGPVPTGFDAAAGADDGLGTGLPASMEISAQECAEQAVRGMERGAPIVYPGRPYGLLMRAMDLVPRPLTRIAFTQMARRS
ncbi:SDR family oxidoreductase [Mariniluteicoccus flavus]